MIDDLQDDYQKNTRTPKQSEENLRSFVVFVVTFAVFTLAVCLFSLRSLSVSLSGTTPREMITTAQETALKVVTKTHILYFADPKGQHVEPFATEVRVSGATDCQEALEGLLKGPGESALRQGYVSHIPMGTRLLGVTFKNSIAHVNLSEEFTDTDDWGETGQATARLQILRTLQVIDPSISGLEISVNSVVLK